MFLGVATVLLDGEGDATREDLLAALLLGALRCQTLFAAGTTPGVAWGMRRDICSVVVRRHPEAIRPAMVAGETFRSLSLSATLTLSLMSSSRMRFSEA